MAEISVSASEVRLALSRFEKFAGLHGDVAVPMPLIRAPR